MVKHLFIIICCMALLSCVPMTHSQRDFHDIRLIDTFWCHLNKSWEAAPKEVADELGYQPYHVSGQILHLCPSGDLEIYGGILNKVNDIDIISLSSGDGLIHFAGKWEIKGDKLLLEYRLVWQDFPPVGHEIVSHPTIRLEVPYDGHTMLLDGKTFTPIKNLDKETMESFFSCPPRIIIEK